MDRTKEVKSDIRSYREDVCIDIELQLKEKLRLIDNLNEDVDIALSMCRIAASANENNKNYSYYNALVERLEKIQSGVSKICISK